MGPGGEQAARLQAFAEVWRRQCDDDPEGFLAQPPPEQDPDAGMVWEYCRGFAANILGRNAEAYPAFGRALELALERGDRVWQARATAGLGLVLGDVGDHIGAIEKLEESRSLRREIGDVDGEASALANLGVVHLQMPGLAHRAIELFQQARSIYLDNGNGRSAAAALMNAAEALVRLAQTPAELAPDGRAHDLAVRALAAALQSAQEADTHAMERISIGARVNAVHAAALLGCSALGERLLAEARTRLGGYPTPNLGIAVRLATAHLLRCQGRTGEAVAELRLTLAESEHVDSSEYRGSLLHELVLAQEAGGDAAGALATFRSYHREQVEERDRAAERQAQWLKDRHAVERAELAEALHRQRAELLAEQNAVLTRQTLCDTLTGLPNRRALLERLDRELATDVPRIALAMADLDHFKQVNDTHSHLIGDRVLRAIADLTRQALREVDLPARYGGEEFALVLAVANTDELRQACDRLRLLVRTHTWHDLAPGLRQTISIGATLARPGDTVQTLTARADERLYAAKRGGRDQVVTDSTDLVPLGTPVPG